MTILCKVCKYEIRSPKTELSAVGDVLKKMGMHLGAVHKEHAAELGAQLATVQALAATFLLFQYAEIPDTEIILAGAYRENRDALMNILQSYPPSSDEPAIPDAPSAPVN